MSPSSTRLKYVLLSALSLGCVCAFDLPCFAAEDAVQLSVAEARRVTISQTMPRYPAGARSAGMKGEGIFLLHVRMSTGEVDRVEVYRSTGFRALDIEAIRALRQWRFRPGTYDRIRIPIHFAGW